MKLAITILTLFILLICLLVVSLTGFVIIRYLISVLMNEVNKDAWRDRLKPGMEVLVIDQEARRRTVVYVNKVFVQVKNAEGNLSGHHISTIYPITRDYGTTN